MVKNILLLFFFLTSLYNCTEHSPISSAPFNPDLDEIAGMNGYAQYEWELTHDPATGDIPVQRLAVAQQILTLRERNQLSTRSSFWKPLGPANVGGRTRALLIDANDPTGNTIFAGSTSGGLYKNRAFKSPSNSWETASGIDENLSISAIVQDPNNPNLIYVGTGEGWGSANDIRGAGVWRSTDGGRNWLQLDDGTEPAFWHVLDIDVDQNGNLYVSTRFNGIQRSSDRGDHWTPVLGEFMGNGNTNAGGDLEIGPDGSVYASLNLYGPGRIFKSDFTINQQNTGDKDAWTDITPPGNYWRIEMAIAPSDKNRIYALCAGSDLQVNDMWRSENGGQSWQSMTIPSLTALVTSPFTASAAWFALIAQVDPKDPNTMYIGGIDLVRTDDGGNTWTHLSSEYPYPPFYVGDRVVHTDQHEILFFPGGNQEALFSNDGGIYYSRDLQNEFPTFQEMNTRYNTTQFYSCALFFDTDLYLGGAQDNGNWAIVGEDLYTAANYFLGAGDGGITQVSQQNSGIFSLSATGIDIAITTDGSKTYTSFDLPGRGDFIHPYTLDDNANLFYGALGSNKYFIIKDLKTRDAFDSVTVSQFQGAKISALTPDPQVSNRLWVAVRPNQSQGHAGIFRIDQANTHNPVVTELSDPGWDKDLAARNIFIDANDPNYLLLTFANYGSPNVWISEDGGLHWTNVDGDLPDMPVRWGIINPLNRDELILATELGVLHSTTLNGAGTKWETYQSGLGKMRVNMLTYSAIGQRLVAATWGQGLYLTNYDAGSASVTRDEIEGLRIYPNPVTDYLNISGIKDVSAFTYTIYDIQGQVLANGQITQSPILTSKWLPGTYLIKITDEINDRQNTYKIIKAASSK
ncbi:MAG: T9SS type A sorting domain-containing protein [Saprospiraceae bacterium]|nr:T9SS type A sorting domain-containing protein [Saprospiraceae bacterium]MCB9317688.1 T9SS type A sorting domain-containing protein [Lewinellaceae bacterium]